MRNVLVVADLRGQELRNVTLEALGAASTVAAGGRVSALLIGQGVGLLADVLFAHGADAVYVASQEELLAQYNPDVYLQVVRAAIDVVQPQVLLMAHSAIGRDLAPMVSAQAGAGQASDVIGIEVDGDEIVFVRPIYAGKAFTRVKIEGDFMVATIRPNNLAPAPQTGNTGVAEVLSWTAPTLRTVIQEVMKKAVAGVDLSEAKIIVSGGRGVKSAEGFAPLRELASVLGAAVGASRGACDAGYCDYALQVGQTGKVVTPDLYIACGISGAIQHLAGMSNSKVIVAINKDPEAPIFKVADYGIVGDLFDVVPALTEAVRTMMG